MASGKILVLLAVIAASPQAYSKSSSLWGQGVFPDDLEWLPHLKKNHLTNSTNDADVKKHKVCETKECKQVAQEFLSSMNKSVDPCEDFYEFSCGGWSTNVIPPGFPAWSRFMIFDNTVKHRVKGILETPPEVSDILPVRQAKKWYRSCMDTETLERRGINPIESILMQAGGWPISMDEEEWNPEEYTWQKVERHYAHLTGSHALYKIDVHGSYSNSEFGTIQIDLPDLTLSEHLPLKYRNYTGNDYEVYVRLVEATANLFAQHSRANVSKEKLRKEAEEIVEFEKELHELESDEFNYVEFTFEDFVEWYDTNVTEDNTDPKGKIDWKSVIQDLFDMANIKVDPSTDFFLTEIPFFEGIGNLLRKTPARTIVNYVHWTFIGKMLIYMNQPLREQLMAYMMEEFGIKEKPPRWFQCVSDMKMGHAASYVFVNEYFTTSTKNAVEEMIRNVQIEMEEKIESSNWLDAESKEIAKEKLGNMKMLLGFPDWYKNKTAILNYYKGLTIGAEYFDNILSYMRYERKKELKKYLSSQEEDGWHIDPITVNALYGPYENALNLPAVDFQAPLFTPQLPHTVNYGIAGVLVGHEIGHGFDDSGIQYGINGSETKLNAKILKSYYQRADCFTDQFDEYYREGKTPDPEGVTPKVVKRRRKMSIITRGENIADTTGVQAVFQASKKLNKHGVDLRLSGLEEFNQDQLFFLSFAAMWCHVTTPEFEKKQRESFDVHSPAKLRVIGAISNTKDFATAFNCRKGSAMNPSNKCDIWRKSEPASKVESESRRRKHHLWETQWKS